MPRPTFARTIHAIGVRPTSARTAGRLVSGLCLGALLLGAAGCEPFGFEPEVIACDIVKDTGCPEGQTCVDLAQPTCAAAGAAVHGDSCLKEEDCAPHHLCIKGPDGSKTCQRRCDITAPKSCGEMGASEKNPKLIDSSCLWVTETGSRGLGYCSVAQCTPATNEGCTAEQQCVGGIEPYCLKKGATKQITIGGQEVTYKIGEAALGAACLGSGHCASGGVCASVTTATGSEQRCLPSCTVPEAGEKPSADAGCAADYVCKPLTVAFTGKDGGATGESKALPVGQGYCALKHCNLVSNAGCGSGQKCIATASGVPGCTVAGGTGLLGSCDQLSDCDAATTCVSGGTQTLCVRKCDTTGTLKDYGCPSGQKCAELKDAQGEPKPSHLGFCVPK